MVAMVVTGVRASGRGPWRLWCLGARACVRVLVVFQLGIRRRTWSGSRPAAVMAFERVVRASWGVLVVGA